MSRLDRSIKKTIYYADFFNFPFSNEDIHFWLISPVSVSKEKINAAINKVLSKKESIYRKKLQLNSTKKISSLDKILKLLKLIPTIKLISVTGSVAVNNSRPEDDIDLMIVTKDNTLWLTRSLVTLLLIILKRRRHPYSSYQQATNTVCLNLWLEERSLIIPENKRNLYTAHEVLQTLPVMDKNNFHAKFLLTNSWISKYLANAYHLKTKDLEIQESKRSFREKLLSPIIRPTNHLLYLIQLWYMRPKITTETISLQHAYFHKIDFSKKINQYLDQI